MKKFKKSISVLLVCIISLTFLTACTNEQVTSSPTKATSDVSTEAEKSLIDSASSKYNDKKNWAYLGIGENKKADLFLLCPTVYTEENTNMALDDSETREKFVGALNMERGIYEDTCRMYAPFYEQMSLPMYLNSEDQREKYLQKAYEDVREAFLYYMENYNNGRPVVIAGFSQGADMSIRLMKEFYKKDKFADLIVADYAIGWHVTKEELTKYPNIKMAQGETDTGTIIAFNSEAESIDSPTILIPDTTLAINPLNWKTDNTVADKSLNKGACFTDYDGKIINEIDNFTGAYIDSKRGALKVVDVSIDEYGEDSSVFPKGVYHVYDYQFFYRNLQENVGKRVNSFLNKK